MTTSKKITNAQAEVRLEGMAKQAALRQEFGLKEHARMTITKWFNDDYQVAFSSGVYIRVRSNRVEVVVKAAENIDFIKGVELSDDLFIAIRIAEDLNIKGELS
jgi:hypothetical protein